MTRETSPAALRFALAAALVAAGSCGQLPSDAATSSAPIFGGTVDTGNEAVMALVHQMGTTGANVCTGTTIAKVGASGIFLTAAHCVSLTQNGKVVVPVKVAATDELYVIPGPDWETSLRAGLYYGVSAVTMHPQYDGNVNTPYDLALVRFVGATASTPVIPTVTAAEDAALAAGTPFTLVGFGKTETNANNSQRRKVDRVVESFTVAQFLYDQRDLKGACQGDSGGPALLSTSGGARVLGVTSFGDEKCTDLGVSVRVAPAASLIQSFISGTPAALSCADCTQAAVSPGNACTAMAAACGDMTTACGKFLACAEACSTQACFNGCKVTYAVGAAAYDMMAICQCNGACQDACRTNSACSPYIKNVAPPTCEQVSDSRPACTACLRGTCCDQAAACAGDADCMACTRLATTGCRTNAAFIALTSCKATCAGNPCTDTVTPDAGAPQQPTDAGGGSTAARRRVARHGRHEGQRRLGRLRLRLGGRSSARRVRGVRRVPGARPRAPPPLGALARPRQRPTLALMKSKAVVAGHAVHPMLVVFPLGLLVTSIVWDVAALVSKNPTWGTIAYWTILAGVVGALVAAVPGFIDWLAIPRGTRARALGAWHMAINLVLVALFAISLLARANATGGYAAARFVHMVWGWLGIGLGTISAWMGGELVETLGISVRAGANPDAPSSLGRGKEPPRLPPSVPRRPTPLPRGH